MESFLREDVDLTYVTKVAVVPFENNSKEQFAAERIRGMAITQILAQGLFDVVDKGLVDSALREEAVDLSKAPMDAATMKRLGQRLTVQAFLLGSIDQAGVVQHGNTSYPELSITLRLVDINTGMIFWQASGNRTGESMGKRLFGFSSDDDFKIALKLLRQIFATISSEQRVKLPTPAAAPESAISSDSIQQIEPSEGSGLEGQGPSAKQVVPAEQGEADGLDAPLDQVESQEQGYIEDQSAPMGQDESLGQEKRPEKSAVDDPQANIREDQSPDQEVPVESQPAPPEKSVPLEQDTPSVPKTSSSQGKTSEPYAQPGPELVPSDQQVEQAWPE